MNTYYVKIQGKANIPNPLAVGPCWKWSGCIDKAGYGRYGNKYAHRLMYEFYIKKIKTNMVLDHTCRNRNCVNPWHLREVTRKINCMENSIGPFALNAKKTHCPKGHEYTKGNTYLHKRTDRKNNRECRKCTTERLSKRKNGK